MAVSAFAPHWHWPPFFWFRSAAWFCKLRCMNEIMPTATLAFSSNGHFQGRGLACLRGGRVVFSRVVFQLSPGDALVLRGRNGAGKSSLLRMMAGLHRPAAGHIEWSGGEWSGGEGSGGSAARLRFLGHEDAIKPVLSALENVAPWVAAWQADGRDPLPASERALARWGLSSLMNLPARYLSAGQRRRVALARLLAAPAGLWLLDEPTNGLDEASVATLAAVIAEQRAAGGMVVVSTHVDLSLPGARLLDLDPFRGGLLRGEMA